MNFDKELNTSGMACPLPIIKTKKALSDMSTGQVLKVVATDVGSIKDMPAFAEQSGHTLLSTEQSPGLYVFYMKRK